MAASLRQRIAIHEAAHATAACILGVPVVSVTIDDGAPHPHRGRYRAPHDLGLETIVTMCLCGPAAEELFCGPIEDGSDAGDLQMAREYLARAIADPVRAAAELGPLFVPPPNASSAPHGRSNGFGCSPMRCCAVAR